MASIKVKIARIIGSSKEGQIKPEWTGWLGERFGNHYAQVSTDITLKLRMAVRDVSRLNRGMVPPDMEEWAKKFEMPPQNVNDLGFILGYDNEEGFVPGSIERDQNLQAYINKYPEDWEIVKKCLGLQRSKSRHACAFVIANKPISSFIPLATVSDTKCTDFTAESVEAVGGLKMDFLKISILQDIIECLKLVNERRKISLEPQQINGRLVPAHRLVPDPVSKALVDIWDLPDDQDVFTDIAEGKTETVFQLGSEGAIQWLPNFNHLKPNGHKVIDSVMAIADFNALNRPGPLDILVTNPENNSKHNMLIEYTRRARGLPGSTDVLPVLSKMVPETYGVMCLAEGAIVSTIEGGIPIQNIGVGQKVKTEDGSYQSVITRIDNGTKDCIEIRMTNGEALCLTPDHRILTEKGWKEANQLTPDDLIKQFWPTLNPNVLDGDDKDWVLGLALADGNLCACTPEIACSSEGFAQKVKEIADKAWSLDCVVHYKTRCWYCRLRHMAHSGTTRNPFVTHLRNLGLKGKDFATKRLPLERSLSLIAGFFEGDGCVANNRIRIKNPEMAREIFDTLQRAHIESALYPDEPGVWTIVVNGYLPLRIKEQGGLREGFVPRPKEQLVCIPRKEESDRNHRNSRRPFIEKSTLLKLSLKYGFPFNYPNPYGKVISIRQVGKRRVFDLSVENLHSFVVGGSIVHNCYQEQLQKVYQYCTDCSGTEAEEFRTNTAKKKKEKVDKAYPKYMERATAKLGKENAQSLWDFMVSWSRYGFNKSHSISYSVISYACAWLKHHYNLEWWCSILQHATKDEINEKFWKYCGHLVLLPDLQLSGPVWTIEGDKVRAPLSVLHGVGDKAFAQLIKYAPYSSLEDFARKVVLHRKNNREVKPVKNRKTGEYQDKEVWGRSALNSGMIYSMMVAGCLDSITKDYLTPKEAFDEYCRLLKKISKEEGGTASTIKKVFSLDAIGRYQKRKGILPAWGSDLRPIIVDTGLPHFLVMKGSKLYCNWAVYGKVCQESVIGLEKLNELCYATEIPDGGYVASVIAYVEARRDFNWGPSKTKQGCSFTFEVGAGKFDFCWWPDKEGFLPDKVKEIQPGQIVVVRLSKFSPEKPFSIQDVNIIRDVLKEEEDDAE